ncbi:hypothetical protein ASPNIDRAFT_38013 [Aspergillus niger ATCC 1015]|uniref:Uncharacterized protein n=1 Tax=Aspergillus niger (strain ATCC 1015 / CBS 113.46 / FGSC A1144 / LSHB Ac4 / NCTC 3858a / NRRL 328 / USDA 3528.7) TaxID=380704 RepID=G3YF43_ASPNA|nr:hypothetical protein ASPNIDRAFT_38013 [Aspergillus niger ATCC 1015]
MEENRTNPAVGDRGGEDAILNTFDLYLNSIDGAANVPGETHEDAAHIEEELARIGLPASFGIAPPISNTDGLMKDYSLALGTGHECAEMAFPRLDAILFLLLAEMKKRFSPAVQATDYIPSFFSQVPLVVDRRVAGIPDSYQETVDYMLCYGSIPALDTNLLVFRDKVLHSDARARTAISNVITIKVRRIGATLERVPGNDSCSYLPNISPGDRFGCMNSAWLCYAAVFFTVARLYREISMEMERLPSSVLGQTWRCFLITERLRAWGEYSACPEYFLSDPGLPWE